MADSFISKLITELTAKTTAADTDLVPIADSNGNFFKMTWQKLKQLLLGTKDISGVGDGTVTGAISELNTNMKNIKSQTYTVTTNSDGSFTINFGKNVIVIAAGGVASYFGFTFGRINGFSVWGFNSTYLKNATLQVDVTYIEGFIYN